MSTDLTTRPPAISSEGASPRRRWWLIAGAVLLVPVLMVGWWLVRPALVDDVVDTAFPISIDEPAGEAADPPVGEAVAGDDAAAVADPMDGRPFPDDQTGTAEGAAAASGSGAEEQPFAEDDSAAAEPLAAEPVPAQSAADAEAAQEPAPAPATQESAAAEVAPPPPAASPVLLSSGQFVGLDNHDASGRAAIFELEDGTRVIRLEDLDADNGPELQLHLVPGRDQTRPSSGSFIAPLQGNKGNQTYELPAGFEIPADSTVLIWCAPFNVAVGGATQNAAG